MRRVSVVIGANYGDEGKGLVTDYLAAQSENALVVRFNGGAQAAHTVVTPNGDRHIFHHFGSGSLTGAKTFLAKHFLVNPIMYRTEYQKLKDLGIFPKPYLDPRCYITTPFDMMVNQAAEKQRGKKRHGSCGLGIHETVHRSQLWMYGLGIQVKDLGNVNCLTEKLLKIRDSYIPQRKKELGLSDKFFDYLHDDRIISRYLDDLKFLWKTSETREFEDLGWQGDFIFEGAQGLLLDMDHTNFPYVTCSKTGILHAATMCQDLTLPQVDVYYVTRSYNTRHGAGPFPNEVKKLPYYKIEDKTNAWNQWQGSLRFGYLDPSYLIHNIKNDLQGHHFKGAINPKLVMTCVDQLPSSGMHYVDSGKINEIKPEEFAETLSSGIGSTGTYLSKGPTRSTITEL